jgi:hypothetical protein
MRNTENAILEAITLFAEYVVADRKVENVTLAQCEEIARHALTNLDKVIAAYELGKAGA